MNDKLLNLAQRWRSDAVSLCKDYPDEPDLLARAEVLENCAIALELAIGAHELTGDAASAAISLALQNAAAVTTAAESSDGVDRNTRREYYVKLARDQHQSEGTLEVDDDAKLSDSGDKDEHGVYVAAWVWVEDPQCKHCGEVIAPDPHGNWIDDSLGDGCDPDVHEPGAPDA